MTHRKVNYLLVALLLGMLVMLQATRAEIRSVREEWDGTKALLQDFQDQRNRVQRERLRLQSECARLEGQLARQKQSNAHQERWLKEDTQTQAEETVPQKPRFHVTAEGSGNLMQIRQHILHERN